MLGAICSRCPLKLTYARSVHQARALHSEREGIVSKRKTSPYRSGRSPDPVVGFLPSRPHLTAFHHGLKEAGFVEGQDVAIKYRSAEDQTRVPLLGAMREIG
jgi:hypothetical protein